MNIVYNKKTGKNKPEWFKCFSIEKADIVRNYHKTYDEYCITPLADLSQTGKLFGTGNIYVKDESYRFGLNAFKGLGGSYCLGTYIADKIGESIENLPFERLISDEVKEKIGQITFVTATDGNHGRGIAWTAKKLGQKAVVYMPKGSALERLENIRKLGAESEITELNYDDTVRFANKMAEENGWVLVQDTAFDGYEEIPLKIMQGYMTMASEATEQLGDTVPTHIFLQAGVGAMSGAISAYMRNRYGFSPKIVIVEPDKADCVYRTAKADDGKLHIVTGDMNTIMAGLACGEPCTIGWELLEYCADAFISMPDSVAADGIRILSSPLSGDDRVISGESGAATFGAVCEILKNQPVIKERLGIDENSVVLCFSTEGATDIENWRNIVWNGAFQSK